MTARARTAPSWRELRSTRERRELNSDWEEIFWEHHVDIRYESDYHENIVWIWMNLGFALIVGILWGNGWFRGCNQQFLSISW